MLEPQKVTPNAESCSKVAKHNRDRPNLHRSPCVVSSLIRIEQEQARFVLEPGKIAQDIGLVNAQLDSALLKEVTN